MRKMLTLSMVLAATLLFAGCSGSEESGTPISEATSEKAITIEASNWAFDQPTIEVEKGTAVTLTFKNADGAHGISIPEYDVNIKKDGGSTTFVAEKTGEYPFYCSVMCGTDHGKMTGKLIVK